MNVNDNFSRLRNGKICPEKRNTTREIKKASVTSRNNVSPDHRHWHVHTLSKNNDPKPFCHGHIVLIQQEEERNGQNEVIRGGRCDTGHWPLYYHIRNTRLSAVLEETALFSKFILVTYCLHYRKNTATIHFLTLSHATTMKKSWTHVSALKQYVSNNRDPW